MTGGVNEKVWNDDRMAALKKLLIDGLSATQCATRLGHGITRNAVIGIVHRKNLQFAAATGPAPKRGIRAPRAPKSQPSLAGLSPSGQGHSLPVLLKRPVAKLERRIPQAVMLAPTRFADLQPRQCRFIVNDDVKVPLFYGAETKHDRSSWCAHHHARVFDGTPRRAAWEKEQLRQRSMA